MMLDSQEVNTQDTAVQDERITKATSGLEDILQDLGIE